MSSESSAVYFLDMADFIYVALASLDGYIEDDARQVRLGRARRGGCTRSSTSSSAASGRTSTGVGSTRRWRSGRPCRSTTSLTTSASSRSSGAPPTRSCTREPSTPPLPSRTRIERELLDADAVPAADERSRNATSWSAAPSSPGTRSRRGSSTSCISLLAPVVVGGGKRRLARRSAAYRSSSSPRASIQAAASFISITARRRDRARATVRDVRASRQHEHLHGRGSCGRGARRRAARAHDARGEGGPDVSRADLHERRRDASRRHRGAHRRPAPQPLQHLLRTRAAAAGRMAQPAAGPREDDAARDPRDDLFRPAARRSRENFAAAWADTGSRNGPSRSASARSATWMPSASSATSRDASTAPSASTSRSIRWPTWRPSHGGHGSCTRSARTPSSPRGWSRRTSAASRATSSDRRSVACMTKHFPGGGPQLDGEDPHFAYGKDQVYPGGMFEYHLQVFEAALRGRNGADHALLRAAGRDGARRGRLRLQPRRRHRAAARALRLRRRRLHGLGARHRRAAAGRVGVRGEVLGRRGAQRRGPAREDRRGGLRPVRRRGAAELLVELVRAGRIAEARIDESARRLLRDKFRLGLFDDPYVDPDEAERTAARPRSVPRANVRSAARRCRDERRRAAADGTGRASTPTASPTKAPSERPGRRGRRDRAPERAVRAAHERDDRVALPRGRPRLQGARARRAARARADVSRRCSSSTSSGRP